MIRQPVRAYFQRRWRWLPAGLWMILTFSASGGAGSAAQTSRFFEPFIRGLFPALSQERIDLLHLLFRKGGHLGGYAVLGGLLWWALGGSYPDPAQNRRRSLRALLLAALYAASDEFHQSLVPGRGAALADVLIDTTGAALALLAIAWALACRARWRQPRAVAGDIA